MKEIKFRAWDKKNKVIIYDNTMNVSFEGNLLLLRLVGTRTYTKLPKEEFILMQFTGLKDKNGKEIYEGDIVETLNAYEHELRREKVIITFNENRAIFTQINVKYLKRKNWETYRSGVGILNSEMEVIGNIYKNPELLEDGK